MDLEKKPLEGYRKIIVFVLGLISSFLATYFTVLSPEQLETVLVTLIAGFFGANTVEHVTESMKTGKDASSIVKEIVRQFNEKKKVNGSTEVKNV